MLTQTVTSWSMRGVVIVEIKIAGKIRQGGVNEKPKFIVSYYITLAGTEDTRDV